MQVNADLFVREMQRDGGRQDYRYTEKIHGYRGAPGPCSTRNCALDLRPSCSALSRISIPGWFKYK